MGKRKKQKAQRVKRKDDGRRKREDCAKEPVTEAGIDFGRLEFHRNAVALMPEDRDKKPGVAFTVLAEPRIVPYLGCTCAAAKRRNCDHMKALSAMARSLQVRYGTEGPDAAFKNSLHYHLAETIADASHTASAASARLKEEGEPGTGDIRILDAKGEPLSVYRSAGEDRDRLVKRLDGKRRPLWQARNDVLGRLASLTLSETERQMAERGIKTRRQAFEESVWHRLAYHAFLEFGTAGLSLRRRTDDKGRLLIDVRTVDHGDILSIVVPKEAVRRILDPGTQRQGLPWSESSEIFLREKEVIPVFHIRKDGRGCLVLEPRYRMETPDGEPVYWTADEVEKRRQGKLIHLPGTDGYTTVGRPDPLFDDFDGRRTLIRKSQVPEFLDRYAGALADGLHEVDESVRNLKVFRTFDRVVLDPEAIHQDWCYLSVTYGFGNQEISLGELLAAKKAKGRYIPLDDGWIDGESPALEHLSRIGDEEPKDDGAPQAFRPMDILRLQAAAKEVAVASGKGEGGEHLRRLLDLKPPSPLPDLQGLTSPLRGYQRLGASWLWFLHQNRLGGLLCDDMGLGKTHQVMALLTAAGTSASSPALIVCPTTVISHWERKLAEHAPGLSAAVYHGLGRDLETAAAQGVVITSYGILLRDAEALAGIPFALTVFDEIQHLKNPDTQSHRAAAGLGAPVKLGLTGTPIENSLWELKALLDLVVPGYLGSNHDFGRRYVEPIEADPECLRREELTRLIRPFTLRRLKSTVLRELPEKIEDVRTCRLSDDQVRLYREAIAAHETGVIDKLLDEGAMIPYIHIFALLMLLKQICDHPAIVKKSVETYEKWASGKWDLFTELLSEGLASGQKIVVYSQFLDMIGIIERHLSKMGVGHAVLTGMSRKRGEIIRRFNEDPDCRVFVGSLKAGGTGIDLVAGSIVIHYDRWWNAAREDQATDRVHRIGQRRGVQVFKLVTEGTLEEKISAIIARKRHLMDSVVKEDDAKLLKAFTREQLLDLLAEPEAGPGQ